MRYVLITLAFSLAMAQSFAYAETLAIINTAPHDVVIGIYEPTESGVRERLVTVKSMTEVRNVPIEFERNDCFAIAYKATGEDKVKRATPAVIQGMAKLVSESHRDRKPLKAELILQYRASSLSPERDSMGSNLFTPFVASFREELAHSFGDKIIKVDFAQIESDSRTKP